MLRPEHKQLLQELKNTAYGQALTAYLDEKLEEIKDVMNTESWEETLGRKFAAQLVKDLFSFMDLENTPQKKKGKTYE